MKNILSIEQFINEKKTTYPSDLKEFFGDWVNEPNNSSKILDSNGLPMVCYHRSKKKFDGFDNDFITKNGWVGNGFYFSDNKDSFKEYGRYIYKAFLNIRNPYVSNADSWFGFMSEVCKKFNNGVMVEYKITQLLKDNGYDGVVYTHWDKGTIISCFEANQIKIIK
jgi:hypothetical protein